METYEELETKITMMNSAEMLAFLHEKKLIKCEMICQGSCISMMKLEKDNKYIDKYVWRCYSKNCTNYQKRKSIRESSFFEEFGCAMKRILKVIIRYSSNQQRCSILESIDISQPTLKKILKKLVILMKQDTLSEPKLGGFGTTVQIDETMLNFKCKSHRGRAPENKTDALTMVEVSEGITKRAFIYIIPNKKIETIIPIIINNVFAGSTIFTDEHLTYQVLTRYGFVHKTVCHKYNFVNPTNGVHTQNIESFNNFLKHEIKKRKGVRTVDREEFCDEVTWLWNNKKQKLIRLFSLIKV